MSTFNKLVLAASATIGVLGFVSGVQAQNYEENVRRYQPQGYYYQQPQYVDPRIARKQAQQQERFVQKYGYQQPAQPYGYGYQQPRYRQQQQYYYQQAPQQYYAPAPRGYYYN